MKTTYDNDVTYDNYHDVTYDIIDERTTLIENIASDITELRDIFSLLQTETNNQQCLLDHIETNVTNTVVNIGNSNEILENVVEKETKKGEYGCYCILILSMLIVITFVILLYKF